MNTLKRFLATAALAPAIASGQTRVANDTLTLPTDLPEGAYALESAYSFANVLAMATPPDRVDQIYFGERAGLIRVVSDLEQNLVEPEPFLDISSVVTTNSENGLLGLAFHPKYSSNGYFYIFYTTNASGQPTNRLSRFTRLSEDPPLADPESELILIDQRDQAGNHNGGDIHFGRDNYLYVALGDEGGGNDSYQNGQFVDKDFFAGLLRIDVDSLEENIEPTPHPAIPTYTNGKAAFKIPADNPLIPRWQADGASPDSPLRLEFYAIGLRNPWRFSFDPVTNDLWLADVGQNQWEEIDLIEKGGNYGWPIREGLHPGPANREPPEGFSAPIDPIFEYGRSQGQSITGGRVYRGSKLPELYGSYVFGDFGSGRIWSLVRGEDGAEPFVRQIASAPSHFTYGVDPRNGDILVSSPSGSVERLVRGEDSPAPDFPQNLSATGAFSDLATLAPSPGLYAYEPNVPFWSDYAEKSRWVSIPGQEQIAYRADLPWSFPTGSVWVKHFDLELQRGNPASKRRVETRFLVKTDRGAYGLSYHWNDAQTEATLAPEEGVDIDFQIDDNGVQRQQTYSIPSRQDCLRCHTEAAGFALSFNTRQLNRPLPSDPERNTLTFLSDIGLLDTPISDPSALPRHFHSADTSATLEQRARSYLAVNCVSCHQPNAGAPLTWDARPHLDLAQTGLINGIPANDGGDSSKRLVLRGSPERSLLLDRMKSADGFSRMPPVGSNEIDVSGVELLTRWISLPAALDSTFQEWQSLHFGDIESPEAAATADPDADGNSNRLEFLNRTLPLDPQSVWRPVFERSQNQIAVRFPMSPDRSFVIQTSDDLSSWTDWQIPGNPPPISPSEPAEATLQAPLPADPAFFRIAVDDE